MLFLYRHFSGARTAAAALALEDTQEFLVTGLLVAFIFLAFLLFILAK